MPDAERYVLWDKLRLYPWLDPRIGWEELAEVAEFLSKEGVRDGEVIAWHNSPHAVYLLLDIKPGFRYMHVVTAITVCDDEKNKNVGFPRVMSDLCEAKNRKETPARYVVSDLERLFVFAGADENLRAAYVGPARALPDQLLPVNMPPNITPQDKFPFDQPTIFRSRKGNGRYIVHKIVR
jgi:hypothetical protein